MSTPKESTDWQVICLCAAWCGVCRDWMPALRELQAKRPDLRFAWIDVEDEDEAMGDVDIETFPTVLIAQGSQARFLGAVPPSGPGLSALVSRLQAQAQQGENAPAAPEAQPLLERLDPLLRGAAM